MQASIILTGDKELDKTLRDLPVKLQKKGIRKATRAAAKMIKDDAVRRVPVFSGELERSLTVRTAKRANGKALPRHTFGHAVATREAMFQGDTFYGGFIEFGTKLRLTRSGESRGAVDETSFIREALYGNKHQVRSIFRRELKQALEQIAGESRR